jgi:hypothetical protein
MQFARSNAQRLSSRHTIEVRSCRKQCTISTASHIVHDAPHLPLHAIQIHCAALLQQLEQPLDLPGPATTGCQ